MSAVAESSVGELHAGGGALAAFWEQAASNKLSSNKWDACDLNIIRLYAARIVATGPRFGVRSTLNLPALTLSAECAKDLRQLQNGRNFVLYLTA